MSLLPLVPALPAPHSPAPPLPGPLPLLAAHRWEGVVGEGVAEAANTDLAGL